MFELNTINSNKCSLNRNHLKYFVIILMLMDHLIIFIPLTSPLATVVSFFSRLTAPTMALFIAEGYFYTRNLNKYMKRLFIFAIISYIPYCFYRTGVLMPIQLFSGNIIPQFPVPNGVILTESYTFLSSFNLTLVIHETSVIFTLFLGLVSIYLWDKVNIPKYVKVILTGIILWLSAFANWQYYLILLCLIFYFLKGNPKKMWITYTIVAFLYIFSVSIFANPLHIAFTWEFFPWKFGVFLVPFFFSLYNGESGKKSAFNKWFFYIFYPLHLLIIGLLEVALHC